jgi:hypothetical protein
MTQISTSAHSQNALCSLRETPQYPRGGTPPVLRFGLAAGDNAGDVGDDLAATVASDRDVGGELLYVPDCG